jgi:hypothetical protein
MSRERTGMETGNELVEAIRDHSDAKDSLLLPHRLVFPPRWGFLEASISWSEGAPNLM